MEHYGIFRKLKIASLVKSILYIVFGICLLVIPSVTKMTVCYHFGGIVLAGGLLSIVNYFIYGYEPFGFIKGAVEILFGILFLACAPQIASAFAFIFGIIFVVRNLFLIQDALDYRRFGVSTWWLDLIFSVLMTAFGIVLIVNPFRAEGALIVFLAISAMADGITSLVTLYFVSNRVKKMKKAIAEEYSSMNLDYFLDDGENGNHF